MKLILQSIGTLFALVTAFLGAMYLLGGDLLLSGLISAVLVTVLYFVVDQLVRRKTEVRKQRFGPVSLVLWAGYVLVSLPLSLLLVHSLNVEIFHRSEIQTAAAHKIAALDGMTKAYKSRVEAELNTLQAQLVPLLYTYAANKADTAAEGTLMRRPFKLSPASLASLAPSDVAPFAGLWRSTRQAVFDKAQVAATDLLAKAYRKDNEQVFTEWYRLKVPLAYAELDTLVATNLRDLKASYEKHTATLGATFTYDPPKVPMLMAEPIALWQRTKPYALLLAVLAFHLMMMLPFLLQRGAGSYVKQAGNTLQERFPEAFEI